MTKFIGSIMIFACMTLLPLSQANAVGLNGCTINNAGANNQGQMWINVTTTDSKVLNFIFPTTGANAMLATALTALSNNQKVNMDVTAVKNYAGVNAIVVISQ